MFFDQIDPIDYFIFEDVTKEKKHDDIDDWDDDDDWDNDDCDD